MRKLSILAIALMLSGLLTTAALAGGQGNGNGNGNQPQTEDVGKKQDQKNADSEAIQKEKEYRQKREAMKQRRDAASEVRKQLIQSDSPGNTGM